MPRKQPPQIKLGYAVEEFFHHLEPAGLSKSAITQKRRTLRMLVKWAAKGEHTLTRNLTESAFLDALADLKNGGNDAENDARTRSNRGQRTGVRTQAGLNAHRGTLKQFANYLKWRKWVAPDFEPVYAITHAHRDSDLHPRKQRRLRIIPFEDWPTLLDAAEHPRDRMALATGLFWARRPGEVCELRWGDIDRHRVMNIEIPGKGSVPVTGWVQLINLKGGKRFNDGEPMPMGPFMIKEYDRYLAWHRDHIGEPAADDCLLPAKMAAHYVGPLRDATAWPLDPTKPLTVSVMGVLVQQALTQAFGWEGNDLHGEGGHTLRRAGLVWAEAHGGLAVAQALAGHANPDTTLRYTKNADGRRRLVTHMAQNGTKPPDTPEPTESAEGEQSEPDTPADAKVIDMISRRRIA